MKKVLSILLSAVMAVTAMSAVSFNALAARVSKGTITANGASVNVSVQYDDEAYFTFKPTVTGNYIFESQGSDDSLGVVYDSNWNEIKRDDDSGSGSSFLITFSATAGQTYYLLYCGYDYESAEGTVTLTRDNIKSVEFVFGASKKIEVQEYENGGWQIYKNSAGQNDFFFCYNPSIYNLFSNGNKIIVTYDDSTKKEFVCDGDEYFEAADSSTIDEGSLSVSDTNYEKQSKKQWVRGKNTMYYSYRGRDFSVPVTVVASDIKSVSFVPVKAFSYEECTNGSWEYYHKNGKTIQYYEYRIPDRIRQVGNKIVVNYINGKSETYVYKLYTYTDDEGYTYEDFDFVCGNKTLSYDYFSNQTEENPWTPESNKFIGISVSGAPMIKAPVTISHIYDSGTVVKAATLTSTGVKKYTCVKCGKTINKTTPKLKKNTLKAKGKAVSAKASKTQKFAAKKAVKVTNAKGAVSYKKVKGNKKITVAKNGKITVKKGLKKGTYKIKVKVTAAGNGTYAAASKTVTVTIKVK